MDQAALIVRHTPSWVFGVFALLIWLGVQSLRPRAVTLARVWMTPAVFLMLATLGALGRRQPAAATAVAGLCGIVLGLLPGVLTAPSHIEVDRTAGRVRFRGSVFPLLRNLTIFAAQYVLAVLAARGGKGLAIWAIGVSGISAGYFLGWSGMFLSRVRHAPQTRLTPGDV